MATNHASAQYQEIIDFHTESGKVSLCGIHTPQGNKPRRMLAGFFTQFRKYRYKGCSLVMVPAARLPADPLGVSYEAGEPGSDPRDLLNPILFHGCHGDNLNAALNTIYKGSFDYQSSAVGMDVVNKSDVPAESIDWESQYYRALSDPSFQKSNVMSAFRKKGLHPLVYNVASNHQIVPNENNSQVGQIGVEGGHYAFMPAIEGQVADSDGTRVAVKPVFMTNRLQSLGWLDTKQVINSVASVDPAITTLPKIFMGLIMLPPAYKTEMYFRMVITHFFEFKQFNTSLSNAGAVDYVDWNADLSVGSGKSMSLETVNSTAEVTAEGVF
nr:MAG: capsid protein [ssDNA virus sp.]